MTEKSQEARKRGGKAQKGDEAIYSLDPHSGLSDDMRRRLLLRRFWQSAGEFWGKDGLRRAGLLSAGDWRSVRDERLEPGDLRRPGKAGLPYGPASVDGLLPAF